MRLAWTNKPLIHIYRYSKQLMISFNLYTRACLIVLANSARWTHAHLLTGRYPNISYKVITLHSAAEEEKLRAYWYEQTCRIT